MHMVVQYDAVQCSAGPSGAESEEAGGVAQPIVETRSCATATIHGTTNSTTPIIRAENVP